MGKIKPQNFGYISFCEMYDSLKDKGVTNQTVYLQRMESNGEVKTHKIRMSTVERNAWREVADTMLTTGEAADINAALLYTYSDSAKKLVKKVWDLVQHFNK